MAQKKEENTERAKRIAVAATAAGVLLVLFLVVVLIIQIAQIGVRKRERAELNEAIARYEQLIAQGENNLEFLQSYEQLMILAMQHGYRPAESKT